MLIIGVDCGPLIAPRNGTVNVSITTYEGVAFYNCSHGYNLIGVSRRMCQANATWSSEEPMCEGKCVSFPLVNLVSKPNNKRF